MYDQTDTILSKLKLLLAGIVTIAGVFLLSVLLTLTIKSIAQAQSAEPSHSGRAVYASSNPNVVAVGMEAAMTELGASLESLEQAIAGSVDSFAATTAKSSKAVANGAASAARSVGNGVASVGRAVGSGVSFVANIPGNIAEAASNVSVVRSVIRPSDHIEVPIIDPDSPALQEAIAALPPEQSAGQRSARGGPGPQWPARGATTTHFGVPHWPWQHTHSGIDISTGRPSGVTPIKPFRPGRVIDVIHGNRGLGNHVIVDHGNGVTSVYAHLASTAVSVGQHVNLQTTLGYEGSTGASTGTHLHFEIRVHGQAADPHQFIHGRP